MHNRLLGRSFFQFCSDPLHTLTSPRADTEENDPLAANYGDVPQVELQSLKVTGRQWVPVKELGEAYVGQAVLLRGRVHNVRAKGKMGFLVLRQHGATVQCVLAVGSGSGEGDKKEWVSKGMVKYAGGLSRESVVEVEGEVVRPEQAIESTTQQVRGWGGGSG